MKTISKPSALNLKEANEHLGSMSAIERIKWAHNIFGSSLFALTSAGIDSALMLDHISKLHQKIAVIHINTGFLPKETTDFMIELKDLYNLQLFEFGPSRKQIEDITYLKLWDGDLAEYSKITKLDPLKEAISKLKVKALLTGIRADQTSNRSKLNFITTGNNGELRINPFIDWSSTEVANYIDGNKLPRNSLYKKGFGSVGDLNTTVAGRNREGRKIMECGIHLKDGKFVRRVK